MTSAAIQDYIDTYIRPNDKKEITGGQMNYLLTNILQYVNDEIGAIPSDTHIGNSNLTISSTARKLNLSGATSSHYFGVFDSTGVYPIYQVLGSGEITAPKGLFTLGGGVGATLYPRIQFKSLANTSTIEAYNNQLIISAAGYLILKAGASNVNQIISSGMQFYEGKNLIFGQATGTKIGTHTNEKIAFWNKTPVPQQILATGVGNTVDDVITFLQLIGLCKQS